jgi:hypothetical protein
MRGPHARRASERALDDVCRDVEATVCRIAKLVLHASALADRMDRTADVPADGRVAGERVRVLREAAEAGRRTLAQVCGAPGSTGVRLPQRDRAPSSVPAPRSS